MVDHRPVVKPGCLVEQFLDGVQGGGQANIAIDVDVDLGSGLPQGSNVVGQLVRITHPSALVPVDVTGRAELHELGDKRAVGEVLAGVKKSDPVGGPSGVFGHFVGGPGPVFTSVAAGGGD